MTLRGQILVSRTDDDTTLPSVCPFKTSPVYDGTTRTCWKACARVAGIHGDVLNVQTEVFSVPHHTAHTAQHTPTHNITQNHTQHHTEKMGKRERQKKEKKEKERERERERKRRKREKERENERERNRERDRETERQRDREKTEEERQDKRRDQESRQDEKEERWNYEFFQQMFQDPQTRQMNEPNMFRKKKKKQNFSDELFLHFFFESSESDRFFNYYMIRIGFFGSGNKFGERSGLHGKTNSIWTQEKPKVDNARILRGLCQWNFKERVKNIGIAYGIKCAMEVAKQL